MAPTAIQPATQPADEAEADMVAADVPESSQKGAKKKRPREEPEELDSLRIRFPLARVRV